ncbi:MAG TPA: hypothetical protein VGB13_05540 [Candidatus Krumholzibacteria bacterium]
MARSSSSLLDRVALAGIAVGLASYVAPVWSDGRLRLAFWLTLAATVLHIVTSHTRSDTGSEGGGS